MTRARARRWGKRALWALGAMVLAAGCEERARTFHFEEDARPAVTSHAEVLGALQEIVERAGARSGWRGCAAIAFGDEAPHVACASGSESTPFDERTRFSIASLWKQMIGFRVQELAAEGRVGLGDAIGDRIPELRGAPVARATVADLLHMTSGLPFVIPLLTNVATQLSSVQRTDDDFLDVVAASPVSFEAGERSRYSNVGYGVLAILIGRIEGRPWRDAMGDVFARAGMTGTGVFVGVEPAPAVVRGHWPVRCAVLFGRPCMLPLPRANYSMLPGGGVYSTIEDLLRWDGMLRSVSRDDPALFAAFTATPVETYASGWGITERPLAGGARIPFYVHSGEDPGYYTYFGRAPTRDVTVYFLSNTDFVLDHGADPLFGELVAMALGEPYAVMR